MMDRINAPHNRTSIPKALSEARAHAKGFASIDARPIFSDPPATGGDRTGATAQGWVTGPSAGRMG